MPGFEHETFIFGLSHGIGFIFLCLLIFSAILRREAPYTLLAATLTPVGPLGSVIAIELIERKGMGVARPEDGRRPARLDGPSTRPYKIPVSGAAKHACKSVALGRSRLRGRSRRHPSLATDAPARYGSRGPPASRGPAAPTSGSLARRS